MYNRIRVRVPGDCTTIIAASGDVVTVADENGQRWAELLPDDARLLINNGLPDCLPWRAANPELAATLGPVPKEQPGIPWSHLHHREDSRHVRWSDKGRIANQAIAALNRVRAK